MSTTEAADLARTILADSEDEHPDALYLLDVREARTLARAVIRVEELADRLDDGHLRYLIRNALNGETA